MNTKDNLEIDLRHIVDSIVKEGDCNRVELMSALVEYIVRRDDVILRHGINLGKEERDKETF